MKTRLSGFVTIKDDWAVQSFGFKNYLPIGKPEIVVENLSRWGVDEIFVNCIDSSKKSNGPNVNILKKIYKSHKGADTFLSHLAALSLIRWLILSRHI